MNSWHHAVPAARKRDGAPEDYIEIEEFIDSSKKIIGDVGAAAGSPSRATTTGSARW